MEILAEELQDTGLPETKVRYALATYEYKRTAYSRSLFINKLLFSERGFPQFQ